MQCPLCGHDRAHKHGKTSKGGQRYLCPCCEKTFTDTFDTIYYRRHLDSDEVHRILQSHTEGSSLRGISRIVQRAYGTVVSLVRAASQKAQITLPTLARFSMFVSSIMTTQRTLHIN